MPRSSPKPRASPKPSARGKGGRGGGGGGGRLQTLALFVTLLAVGALLASLGYGIWQHFHPPSAAPAADPAHRPAAARAPAGRVRVQVLNATRTHGLARVATDVLRDRGFDVVETGNAPRGFGADSSLVLDRVGHLEVASQAAAALGITRVETKLDSTLIVEATVVLGNDWKAPADQQ
jgi:hypothetical protein